MKRELAGLAGLLLAILLALASVALALWALETATGTFFAVLVSACILFMTVAVLMVIWAFNFVKGLPTSGG